VLSIDTMVDDLDALGIVGKVALAGIAVGGAHCPACGGAQVRRHERPRSPTPGDKARRRRRQGSADARREHRQPGRHASL